MSTKVDYKPTIPSAGKDARPPGADRGGRKAVMDLVITINYSPITQGWDLGRLEQFGGRTSLTLGVGVGALSRALVEATLGSRVNVANGLREAFADWRVEPEIRADLSQ